ncbi:Hypp727 [Branchiostoma lanceolatum]|uniref:Hypp727 protein n=1 Tax=Branchiostoma lanceolatum TaxID=7740 RepID=A0A8J9YK74_BRALA|nr:Hypp727 [Branchiostoma lanceolatum]
MMDQHDQIGQDQCQAFTESKSNTTAGGHDQARQGKADTISESNTNTLTVIMTDSHDQTGQDQPQAFTESKANTTAGGHDQVGQGKAETISGFDTNTSSPGEGNHSSFVYIAWIRETPPALCRLWERCGSQGHVKSNCHDHKKRARPESRTTGDLSPDTRSSFDVINKAFDAYVKPALHTSNRFQPLIDLDPEPSSLNLSCISLDPLAQEFTPDRHGATGGLAFQSVLFVVLEVRGGAIGTEKDIARVCQATNRCRHLKSH